VGPPVTYPSIAFDRSRVIAYPGDSVIFDASRSFDSYGSIVSYKWSFGDGSTAYGVIVDHTFMATGNYSMSLTLENDRHYTSAVNFFEGVVPRPGLVPYQDWQGFRLLIPSNWVLEHNVTVGSIRVGMVLFGPDLGFRTNVVGSTNSDPNAQETESYLRQLVSGTLATVRQQLTDATLSGSPEFRILGNHSAVFFAIRYPLHGYSQEAAVVVSQPHQRDFILILSAADGFFLSANETFQAMLLGFAITLAPLPLGPPAGIFLVAQIVGAALGVMVPVVLVIVYLVRRRNRARGLPAYAACPRCDTPFPSGAKFCGSCGSPLPSDPPPPLIPPRSS
jgi:hypothetical protein